MKICEILGIPVSAVTYETAVQKAAESVDRRGSAWILAINPEKIMKALSDEELRRVLLRADLFIPDGIGVIWAARLLGKPLPQRVTGVDLLELLVKEAANKGWKIFLLGAAPGVAEEAAAAWRAKYPALLVAGAGHGFFTAAEERFVTDSIREAAPDILFVAMGSPRQEKFIERYKDILGVPVCMGVGGGFDVISGRKNRAPRWMQKIGLEWTYRLLLEPARILRMSALPGFIFLVLRKRLGLLHLKEDK